MTSTNAPPLAPSLVRAPKVRGDWVVETWTIQTSNVYLEGLRKGSTEVRPEFRFTRRATRVDVELPRYRVDVDVQAPDPLPGETTEISLDASARRLDTQQRRVQTFAQVVDALPLAGSNSITEFASKLPIDLEDKTAWSLAQGSDDSKVILQYAPPTTEDPVKSFRALRSTFEGELVMAAGLPQSLRGVRTTSVSQAAFSGEPQVWTETSKVVVSWSYGSAP